MGVSNAFLGAALQAGGGAAWLQRGDVVAGVVGCRSEPWALEARLADGWPLLESAGPAVRCAHQLRARVTPRDAPQALRHRLTWVLGAACGACGRAAVRCGGVERPAAPLRPDALTPSPPQTHPVDDGARLRAHPSIPFVRGSCRPSALGCGADCRRRMRSRAA